MTSDPDLYFWSEYRKPLSDLNVYILYVKLTFNDTLVWNILIKITTINRYKELTMEYYKYILICNFKINNNKKIISNKEITMS